MHCCVRVLSVTRRGIVQKNSAVSKCCCLSTVSLSCISYSEEEWPNKPNDYSCSFISATQFQHLQHQISMQDTSLIHCAINGRFSIQYVSVCYRAIFKINERQVLITDMHNASHTSNKSIQKLYSDKYTGTVDHTACQQSLETKFI